MARISLAIIFILMVAGKVYAHDPISGEKCSPEQAKAGECAVYVVKKGDSFKIIMPILRADDPALTFRELLDFAPNSYIKEQKIPARAKKKFRKPEDLLRPGYKITIPRISKASLAQKQEKELKRALEQARIREQEAQNKEEERKDKFVWNFSLESPLIIKILAGVTALVLIILAASIFQTYRLRNKNTILEVANKRLEETNEKLLATMRVYRKDLITQ